MTTHFALVPLKLDAPGAIELKVSQLPHNAVGFQPVDPALVERIVARPFSFSVSGEQ
jgi:hypothetical protein